MTDLSGIAEQFAQIVGDQLEDRASIQQDAVAQAQLVTATLAKPMLMLPQDLMTIAGCKKSAAYKLIAHENFPETFTLGRQQFVRTEDFLSVIDRLA